MTFDIHLKSLLYKWQRKLLQNFFLAVGGNPCSVLELPEL